MKLTNIKAAIFDLDGTLIDTEKIYRQVWPAAMKQLGYVFTDEQYLQLRSMGRPFALNQFKAWYGENFDYDGARKVRKVLFDNYISEKPIELKKGAIELLEYLRERGIITAIATATDPARASEYMSMTGLTNYFDKLISATMVDEGKPSPKVYQYACAQLGFPPSQCIAVEDAPNGVLSAYRAGLNVIMVPDQTGPDDELRQMSTAIVDDLSQIVNIL